MSFGAWAEEKKPVFNVITIDGVITSPTAKYVANSIKDAQQAEAEGLIIYLILRADGYGDARYS